MYLRRGGGYVFKGSEANIIILYPQNKTINSLLCLND